MENRQRMEQHIVGRKAPRIAQREGIGGEIAVAEHRSLRPARRSRCIEDRRNIPLVPGDRLERRRRLSRLFGRSEEHTSELQSLMRNSSAVFGLKNKQQTNTL